ncbi:MAG TPA: SGNH/GDSL hydrolase family protein [Pyrinomonadaceae bacterium]|jgi:hypothetical protein
MGAPKKSLRLRLKRVALLLASVFVALAVVEVALRLFRPSYSVAIPWSYEYDDELAFRLKPGAHLFRTTDHQQESVTNRAGTSNFQESFEEYPRLVFTVGDSFTQGIGVPADASYPFQLDLFLNRDAEGFYVKRFGVVNLGVAGFGGDENLLALRRHVALLRRPPSYILYLGCDNDMGDDVLFRSGVRHKQFLEGSPYLGRLAVAARWMTEELQLGLKVKRYVLERNREKARAEAARAAWKDGREMSAAEFEAPVLERLNAYAKEQGATLVISWSNARASYYWLKEWAARNGVAFADWAPRVESVTSAIPALPPDNNHSGGHHRTWTNRVIAEEFARQMGATASR